MENFAHSGKIMLYWYNYVFFRFFDRSFKKT